MGLPQNMPKWHMDYFELQLLEKQPIQKDTLVPLCLLLKAKIKSPQAKGPSSCTWG